MIPFIDWKEMGDIMVKRLTGISGEERRRIRRGYGMSGIVALSIFGTKYFFQRRQRNSRCWVKARLTPDIFYMVKHECFEV